MRLSPTLSRYIGRQFLIWFGVFFSGLMFIIFVADVLELLRRSASKPDVTIGIVLKMALFKLPHTAESLMAFAILFGGIMAFWRLTRSNELIVARAVGVSVWQFMAPAVIAAVLLGVVKVTVFNPIAAAMLARYEQLEAKTLHGQIDQLTIAPTGLWLRQGSPDGGEAIIHADKAIGSVAQLQRVTVLLFKPDNSFETRLDATSARLEPGHWMLEDTFSATAGQPSAKIGEYSLPTQFTVDKIQESFARPETMSFWALPGFIDLLQRAGFSAIRHRLYLQSLLAGPLLLSAMILIAATFSLRPARRGGVGTMLGLGVGTGFLLYFVSDLVFALGLSARIPVVLAAWAPALISTLLGFAMLLHLEDG
ncbi:MAG TPA: LPS export ABC transporter permease LptG [Candidatus Sulfotelmatobacter sp.]|nr:LPS export ABC transporter permease LptG [Candidatus Sulfotelmatobacter sp.]